MSFFKWFNNYKLWIIIINQYKIKKLLVLMFLFVSININAQYQVWTFVKAVPGENFDKL